MASLSLGIAKEAHLGYFLSELSSEYKLWRVFAKHIHA